MNNIKHTYLLVYMIYTSIHIDIVHMNEVYIYFTDINMNIDMYTQIDIDFHDVYG
jgi:hypothetical protein